MSEHPHVLAAIEATQWLATEQAVRNIWSVASRDIGAGLPVLVSPRPGPRITGSTAVLTVAGPILPRASLMTSHSGATSLAAFDDELEAAIADPAIERVVLAISSPGGAADGIASVAERIYQARKAKPITAVASDLAASAALWLGSAASEFLASPAGIVGSLGVVLTVRRSHASGDIEIVSTQSPRKREDPSSAEGRANLQRLADSLGQTFVEAVSRYRGVSVAHALEHFGQGGLLTAHEALRAGLIDGISHVHAAGGFTPTTAATVSTDPIRAAWDVNSALRVEFGYDFARYAAYARRHEARP